MKLRIGNILANLHKFASSVLVRLIGVHMGLSMKESEAQNLYLIEKLPCLLLKSVGRKIGIYKAKNVKYLHNFQTKFPENPISVAH